MPLHFLSQITSTNDYFKKNITDFNSNFSGIYTFNQTQGRGQIDNKWQNEAGKNIALTFCLNGNSVNNINLSFWVPLIVRGFIKKNINKPTFIKWPNDILISNKKVCGILIEKSQNTFIIGIGINVLQENFINLPRASSLYLFSSKKFNLHQMVSDLMLEFESSFELSKNSDLLLIQYNSFLFGKDRVMSFESENSIKNGIIRNVDCNGLLNIEFDHGIVKKFRIKEVKQLF